jgi:hypothetical protein
VTFHPEISYAEAQRRGQQQELILDRLTDEFPGELDNGVLSDRALTSARDLLAKAGL